MKGCQHGSNPRSRLTAAQAAPTSCSIGVPTGVRLSSLLFGQGGDELAAEVRDVWDHPAPDQVTLAERRLVHPGRAGVLQVVFNDERASSAGPFYYASRDRDEPPVADDPDDLVPVVHGLDEVCNLGIAPQLVRRPAAWHHDA